MAEVVRFKAPGPIYVEVMCPECGAVEAQPLSQRRQPVPYGAAVINNEIGQTFRCPNCRSQLVVVTEAVVVRLLEGEGTQEIK